MMRKRNGKSLAVLAAFATVMITTSVQAANDWAVDSSGHITLNGAIFRVKGGSWFGLEGRQEAPSDPTNPGGAPMELYIGNTFWNPSGRTLAGDAAEIKSLGFNSIRIPVTPQTLSDADPQGRDPNLKNDTSVRIQGAFSALKATIQACSNAGLYVLLDLHSCSNYVGWRAGRIDARPPYVDATRPDYDFTRENYSCADSGNPSSVTHIQAYNVSKWLADLQTLAGLGTTIGVDNIMGIDIFNEPWDYSWSEWTSLVDQAYTAISSVNPNILIFAEGISNSNGSEDGTPNTVSVSPSGDTSSNPNWGENLFEAGAHPPTVPKNKLVFSPHTYGPSVYQQKMFTDPTQPQCNGLEGDSLGQAKCRIVINQSRLDAGWHNYFGYLKAMGYAVVIGEFGGNMDWPEKAVPHEQNVFSYLTDHTTDEQWQDDFVNYLIREGIYDSFYWSINPESGDTYGVYTTPYDPISNTSGWGTWGSVDTRKMDLLKKLWDAQEVANPGQVLAVDGNLHTTYSLNIGSTGMISYSLPVAEFVSLRLYDINGTLRANVIDRQQAAGAYSVDRRQMNVGPGLYLVQFQAGGRSENQKIYLAH